MAPAYKDDLPLCELLVPPEFSVLATQVLQRQHYRRSRSLIDRLGAFALRHVGDDPARATAVDERRIVFPTDGPPRESYITMEKIAGKILLKGGPDDFVGFSKD